MFKNLKGMDKRDWLHELTRKSVIRSLKVFVKGFDRIITVIKLKGFQNDSEILDYVDKVNRLSVEI